MQKKKLLVGSIKRHPDGFGFFIPDDKDHADVFIPSHSMTGVMTNDRVMIEVSPDRGTDRFKGEIIRITVRGTKKIVGRFKSQNPQYGVIKDESKSWGQDLKIKIENSLNAIDGQLVVAEITSYPQKNQEFTGKVIEIIGDATDPLNDIRRILIASNIPQEFNKSTLVEASTFGENPTPADFKDRKDLRQKKLITIDGATAKDFDDAVYVEKNPKGFTLYVAIADVSHYVKIGTSMDRDAYERGTSVYFPNFVVPMLPEKLSNGLCSLNPLVPRLCLVAEIELNLSGETTKTHFYEGVMESKARVTYGEAQEIIDGGTIEKLTHVNKEILLCAELAKILMAKRFREGSLDLEIPETEVVVDAAGVPVDIIRSERLFAHRLIEEMMLAANVAVAKFLSDKKIPAIFRIHEPPNAQAIQVLQKYLWNFGGRTHLGTINLQKILTKALTEFAGKPESQILNILTLRSMSQARYHQENIGHFGLGFEFYTHFTSPIRRYPDLIVHRLLKSQIMPNSNYRVMSKDDLATAGTVLSACEQRAVKAERQVVSIKKARFIAQFIDQEFDGVVSGIAKFGVFVLLRQYDLDGLVKLENLGKDRFEFDEENLRLISRQGKVYQIGVPVRIRVSSVDISAGQINFALAGSTPQDESKPSKKDQRQKQTQRPRKNKPDRERKGESSKDGKSDRKDSQKRGKTKKNRRGIRKTRILPGSGKNKSR